MNYIFLPAAISKRHTQPHQMKRVIEMLKSSVDYIVIDSPTGIGQGFDSAVVGADKAIVVFTRRICY
jgi:septum site-determining protein MinD